MKRIIGVLTLAGMLAIPSAGFAANEQTGIYVAPKFVYSLTQMNSTKAQENVYNRSDNSLIEPIHFSLGNKNDSTFGGSFAIGYDFEKKFSIPVRAEIEYAIFSNADAKKSFLVPDRNGTDIDTDIWKFKFGVQTLFLNAYWDINTGTKFTPYVGAGFGMGIIKHKADVDGWNPGDRDFSDHIFSKTKSTFAWNLGAGLGYDINDNWTIDAGYRFVWLGSVKSNTTLPDGSNEHRIEAKSKLYQHQISIGIRYTF